MANLIQFDANQQILACDICGENLEGRENQITRLFCGHAFHTRCLEGGWRNLPEMRNTCPLGCNPPDFTISGIARRTLRNSQNGR